MTSSACTWLGPYGGIGPGTPGGVENNGLTFPEAQALCVGYGPLVCGWVTCDNNEAPFPNCKARGTGALLPAMGIFSIESFQPATEECYPDPNDVALADRWYIGVPTATKQGSTYVFQYPGMSQLWLGTDTAVKIRTTIYGENCMVDEMPASCLWEAELGVMTSTVAFADGDAFEYTLVEAQVKCVDLGDTLCKAVVCPAASGLCTVRATDAFIAGVAGDTSYKFPTGTCTLATAPSDTVGAGRAFTANSLTWTNDLIDVTTGAITTSTDPLLQYSLTSSPEKMEASTSPDPDYGARPTLKFCVRLGLYPDKNAVTAEKINIYESVVTIGLDFDGSFKAVSIGVQPKERGTSSGGQTYTATAELCGATGTKTPLEYGQAVKDINGNFNQGAAIMVCIELAGTAKADGVIVNKINKFEWDQEGSITKTQAGILDGETDLNGLTMQTVIDNDSAVGVPNVIVTSVLFAKFYEDTGSVRASGSVAMGFPSRRLRNTDNRHLQEADPVAAFDVAATLNKADDGPVAIQQTAGGNGGTYSISNVVGIAITSIVGLLVSNTVLLA